MSRHSGRSSNAKELFAVAEHSEIDATTLGIDDHGFLVDRIPLGIEQVVANQWGRCVLMAKAETELGDARSGQVELDVDVFFVSDGTVENLSHGCSPSSRPRRFVVRTESCAVWQCGFRRMQRSHPAREIGVGP